jgi:outer membrane protein assembly factor BamE
MRNILISGLISVILFLSGCSWSPDLSWIGLPRVYKIDIQQGNVIEQDQVNQLRPGMNKQQVRFIMGTPMINDTFHADRWDYIYRFKPGYGEIEKKRMTVFFENDRLATLQGDYRPGEEAEKQYISEEVIVVPLEEYEQDGSEKGYLTRFFDFFRWTDEQRGIPEGDIPVSRPNPHEEGPIGSDGTGAGPQSDL